MSTSTNHKNLYISTLYHPNIALQCNITEHGAQNVRITIVASCRLADDVPFRVGAQHTVVFQGLSLHNSSAEATINAMVTMSEPTRRQTASISPTITRMRTFLAGVIGSPCKTKLCIFHLQKFTLSPIYSLFFLLVQVELT